MMKKRITFTVSIVCLLCWSLVAALVNAQDAQITTQKVAEGIYMLSDNGGNGNIGVSAGADGVFLIDAMAADRVEKIQAAVAEISQKPIRFLLNTHWHFDHVGGNEKFGQAGAIILAHDNVYQRVSTEQELKAFKTKFPALPKAGLPILTFAKDLTFHLNGEEIYVFHPQVGHTDGDGLAYFRKANVLQTGDLYFEGVYPFIDIESGGSVKYMITVIENVLLPMLNDDAKIIPGHGPLANKAMLQAYAQMLEALRDKVTALVNAGKTLEEVVAAKPTQEFDAQWGNGFLKPDDFARLLYMDLARK